MKRLLTTWALHGISLLLFSAAASPAWAQVGADEGGEPDILDPVVVHGSKEESLDLSQDRAASGTVVLSEDFDDAGEGLPDVVDRQAGVRVTRLGGPASFSTLSIRGSTSDQVLVVLDGVPLNSAVGGPVDLSRIPLGNVERIEIYRGASPLLFGASAMGGAVSITTRTATRREGSVSLGGGSFWSREARGHFTEPGDRWGLVLGLDYSGWEGAFPYVNDHGTRFDPSDDETVTRRNNRHDQVNFLGKARLRMGPLWSFTLTEWMFWRDQGVPGLGAFQTQKTRLSVIENLTVLSARRRIPAVQGDWRLQAGFRYSESTFEDPLDEIGLSSGDSRDRSMAPSISSSLKSQPLSWMDVTGQVSYRYEGYEPNATGTAVSDTDRHLVSAAMETGLSWDALDLLFLPSGRIEWMTSHQSRNDGTDESSLPPDRPSQHQWSWRGALVNTSVRDTRLTLSGGRAVRFPSLFELFGNTGRVMGNADLKAESAFSLDAGVIYDPGFLPAPHGLRLEFNGFYSDVTDLIQYVQTAQGVARAENVDRALLWGVEAGARADLFSHLRIRGNYTFLRALNQGDVAARQDKVLPLRPASKWYVRAEGYLTRRPEIVELSLFVDSEWVAGNYLDNANLVSVSSRFYLNAGAGIELADSRVRMAISAGNLTDERTADLAGYPLPGRSYHVLLTVKTP
jgi:iron complex outermembrane receptor protein